MHGSERVLCFSRLLIFIHADNKIFLHEVFLKNFYDLNSVICIARREGFIGVGTTSEFF